MASARPTTLTPTKAAKAAPKPLKKGAPISWTTGSRFGTKTHQGTVVCFVAIGKTAATRAPSAAKAFISLEMPSNRNRYVVLRADGSFAFANAKSVVAG